MPGKGKWRQGWAWARENRGKGGRGWFLADPQIHLGRSPAPNLNFLAPLLASRDPVGIQSGSSRDQSGPNFGIFRTAFGPVGKQLKSPQNVPKPCKNAVFCDFGWFRTALGPDWVLTGSRLGPDWIPTGSRLDPDWIPTGSRPDPDRPKVVPKNGKMVRDSRFAFFKKIVPWPL